MKQYLFVIYNNKTKEYLNRTIEASSKSMAIIKKLKYPHEIILNIITLDI